MAEADISKIVGLIMQNPGLIEQIKNLAEGSGTEKTDAETAAEEPVNTELKEAAVLKEEGGSKSRRRELLSALKPYLSNERSHAIDAMMSISEILDMVKTR